MVEPHDAETSERLDALRRGLYRPGSTEADLARYLEERAALVPDSRSDDAPPPARPWRPLLLVGVSAALGLALVGTLIVALARPEPKRTVAASSAVATASATATFAAPLLVVDVGDGQTLAVRADAVTTVTAIPASVRGKPVVGQLFGGSGNAVLSIDPPADQLHSGVATVLITANARVPVAWRALARLRLGRASSQPLVLGRGISAEPSNAPAPQSFRYEAQAWPARIAVAAPSDARWSVVVAVASEDELRR